MEKIIKDNVAFAKTELKTLMWGSLLILKAIVTPSLRRFFNPAAAYEEAQRLVNEERAKTQLRNTDRKLPTP
jgi:hypothetical protein